MGQNLGMLKYIVFAPLARPVNFFKYGGGFIAFWSALNVLGEATALNLGTLIDAYVAYLSTKYLPPTHPLDVILPIMVGAIAAGVKWRASQF